MYIEVCSTGSVTTLRYEGEGFNSWNFFLGLSIILLTNPKHTDESRISVKIKMNVNF